MATLRQTWAEFLEGGLRTLWPGMDDDQKLALVRYVKTHLGKTTIDGVRITWDRVGRAVGATGGTLKHYYRRSEAKKSGPHAGPTEGDKSAIRSAKSALRKHPELAAKILDDPYVRRVVTDELHPRIDDVPGRRAVLDTLDSIDDGTRITGPLAHLRSVARKAANKVAEIQRPRKSEREQLLDTADDLRFYADLFEAKGQDSIDADSFASELQERETESR